MTRIALTILRILFGVLILRVLLRHIATPEKSGHPSNDLGFEFAHHGNCKLDARPCGDTHLIGN